MPSDLSAASLSLLNASSTAFSETRRRLEEEVVQLFDQFRVPLLRYLSSFGLGMPDAEEVIQEVFLSLFQHLSAGKSRRNLRGWLFRVAHNQALQKRLQARRGNSSSLPVDAEEMAVEPGPNPEEHLVMRRRRRIVEAVLQALPEQDRRCLSLRAEGFSCREVADFLGISLGSVSSKLTRALARIASATKR